MEEPGPLDTNSNLRTISDTLTIHQGFALAAFLCFYIETIDLIATSKWKYMTCFLSYTVLVGFIGCIVYSPDVDPNHFIFAATFFFFTLVLSTVRYLQYLANFVQILCVYLSFGALLAVAYFQKSVLGEVEIVYVYFVLNSWVYCKSSTWQQSLMAKLYDNVI